MAVHSLHLFLLGILLIIGVGCGRPSQATTPTDVGPTYAAPPGNGPVTIEGITYGYVATQEREQEIITGFRKLSVGQSREDVREAMGPPDSAETMWGKDDFKPFTGWSYMYKIRMRPVGPNTSDVCIHVFFNPKGKLEWAVPSHIAGLSEVGHAGGE